MEDILGTFQMKHEQAKKNSIGNNKGVKINVDVTMIDSVPDELEINGEFSDPY